MHDYESELREWEEGEEGEGEEGERREDQPRNWGQGWDEYGYHDHLTMSDVIGGTP